MIWREEDDGVGVGRVEVVKFEVEAGSVGFGAGVGVVISTGLVTGFRLGFGG